MTRSTKRLFIALWPDDEIRKQVQALQHSLKYEAGLDVSAAIDNINIHITLHFLGTVPEKDIPLLAQALDGISGNAFVIKLDRLGYFSKPKILWLGCTEPVDALKDLHRQTARVIKKCLPGYRLKKHVPHVTLFRKATQLPQKEHIDPILWHADNFVLVESKTYPEGVQYRILQQWPFTH